MIEEKNKPKEEKKEEKKNVTQGNNNRATNSGAAKVVARSVYGERVARGRAGRRGGQRFEKKDDFEQRILDIARVTRVMAGGKRMRFRVCVAIGDRKGKIGVSVGKGADVAIAVNKAVNKAKKNLVDVPIINDTIPHEVFNKFSAAKILFKPARKGRGVIAGSVVRVILELAGVKNITSKILGTNNKLSNAKCTIEALRSLRRVEAKKIEKKDEKNDNKKEEKKKNNL